MSESVIGIAVLDTMRKPQYLHCLCAYKDGTKRHEGLPVYAKGEAEPVSIAWQYEISGNRINVSPSVRISTTKPNEANPAVQETVELFHNEGSWSVEYRPFVVGEYLESYDYFKALNSQLLQ